MSEAFDKGRDYERKIQKRISKILRVDAKRDSKSGGGSTHKADIRDRYRQVPLFIECKHQNTLKLKEWFRDADGKSSFGQAPAVVFPMETNAGIEDLVCLRFDELLQFIREMMDWRESTENMQAAVIIEESAKTSTEDSALNQAKEFIAEAQSKKDSRTCRNGHIADEYGFCQIKACQYRRGYKPKKSKKGK